VKKVSKNAGLGCHSGKFKDVGINKLFLN